MRRRSRPADGRSNTSQERRGDIQQENMIIQQLKVKIRTLRKEQQEVQSRVVALENENKELRGRPTKEQMERAIASRDKLISGLRQELEDSEGTEGGEFLDDADSATGGAADQVEKEFERVRDHRTAKLIQYKKALKENDDRAAELVAQIQEMKGQQKREMEALEATLNAKQRRLAELEAELRKGRTPYWDEMKAKQDQIDEYDAKIKELEASVANIGQDASRMRDQMDEMIVDRAKRAKEIEEKARVARRAQNDQVRQLNYEIEESKREAAALARQAEEADERFEKSKGLLTEAMDRLSNYIACLQEQISEKEAALADTNRQREALERQAEELAGKKDELEAQFKQEMRTTSKKQSEVEALTREIREVQEKQKLSNQRDEAATEERISELKKELENTRKEAAKSREKHEEEQAKAKSAIDSLTRELAEQRNYLQERQQTQRAEKEQTERELESLQEEQKDAVLEYQGVKSAHEEVMKELQDQIVGLEETLAGQNVQREGDRKRCSLKRRE